MKLENLQEARYSGRKRPFVVAIGFTSGALHVIEYAVGESEALVGIYTLDDQIAVVANSHKKAMSELIKIEKGFLEDGEKLELRNRDFDLDEISQDLLSGAWERHPMGERFQ